MFTKQLLCESVMDLAQLAGLCGVVVVCVCEMVVVGEGGCKKNKPPQKH